MAAKIHYTEDTLVQQTTAEYLEQQLGWLSVFAYNKEEFEPGKVWHWHERGVDVSRKALPGQRGKIFMKPETLLAQIALGEDSSRQFKTEMKNADSLASEMAAFANTGGMVISGRYDPINDLISMKPAA